MLRFLLAACTLFVAATASQAQLGVYGGFTASTLHLANTPRIYGGTFGAYFDGSRHLLVNFGIDARGTILRGDNNYNVTSVMAGPRVVFHLPVVPLRPYAEGLVGGAHVRVGQGFATYDSGGFAGGIAVGADLHILPFVDWRVLDYSYNRLQAATTQQQTITTGIVIRIPFS